MKETVDVNTGEVQAAKGNIVLRSPAIGSCVVVAAYDSTRGVGALAHVMLPGRAPKKAAAKAKYACDAIEEMLERISELGSDGDSVEVCLVGAGNVLKREDDTICRDNAESVSRLLEEKGIPIRASAMGGFERKAVFLDVNEGSVQYTEGGSGEKALWQASGR